MTWWAWMILGAVLLAAELFAVDAQFYLVFLGVSAAIVGLASLIGINPPEWMQWLAFAIISVVFFVTFRKALYEKLRGGGEGYQQRYLGEVVTVSEDVAPGGRGRAQYRGSDWNIQNVGESAIAAGAPAKVVEVDGLTLNVEAE
ncbi:MAG: NfeD family protein [Woeseiaceae bacterium]|nr:NfeD family protein [Woeseiaceae bacterium]